MLTNSVSDSRGRSSPHPPEQPTWLRGPLSRPAQLLAHSAALPIRALARGRPPAVPDPQRLTPGDAPLAGDKLLLLVEEGCGICRHARDVSAALDRRHRSAKGRIARHDGGLLAHLVPEPRYGAWHVVHPDGRREGTAAGLAA